MCDDAIYYNGTTLWSHWDNDVTSNTLNFDFFTYQSNNQLRLQQPKFKFVIYSQSSTSSSVTLFNSELYKYYYILKRKILDNLNDHLKSLSKDNKYTDGFTFVTRRNNIYTTILYNNVLNDNCIRFMIGEKEKSILDTDKIYIPLIEFNSLYLTIYKAFENYCVMSQQVSMLDTFKKYTELFDDKITDLEIKLKNLNCDETPRVENIDTPIIIEKTDLDLTEIDQRISESESNNDTENIVKDDEIKGENDSFNDFLKDNRDSFELDLPAEQSEEARAKTQKEIVHENFFPSKLLKDDFSNLDKIIFNCINSKLPLDSFVNTVYTTCNIDLCDSITVQDKYAINYIVCRNIKDKINDLLTKKVDLPKSTLPIIVEDTTYATQEKIDCACFLLMSYIYISKVNNDLAKIEDYQINKSLISYCLKTITSPFVFKYILNINKDVLINCIDRLYTELRNKKFFDKYQLDIYNKTKINIEFNNEYLREHIEKIYNTIQERKDKFSISKFFKLISKILDYSDFGIIEKYNSDIIQKIIDIEYKKDVISTNDIPIKILEKYGIKDLKYDNNILVKYIKSKYPDFKDIEQIKNINISVKDIIKDIDINSYPVDILKALYFWNVNLLPKNIKYDDFCKIVDSSNLKENELISMILDDNYKIDDSFYNSLELINNECR